MRERRNYLLIIGAIGALLVGALFLAIPGSPVYKKPTLGLDLQGGLEVILRAIPETQTQPITPPGMATAQQIMTNRVDKLGVTSPNVAVQGGNQIVIQLAGVNDPAKAAKIVGTTGTLQMFDFETNLAPPTVTGAGVSAQPAPLPSLYGLLTAVQKDANKGTPQASLPLPDRQEEDHDEGQGQEGHEDEDVPQAPAGRSPSALRTSSSSCCPTRTGSGRPARRS